MTGGAAQKEQYPACALCGVPILYSPVSLAYGLEQPRWYCPDERALCLRRAVER